MVPVMACLTDNTVAAFLEGALPGERQGRVRSHLDSCTSCRALLEVLRGGSAPDARSDPLVGAVLAESYEVQGRIGAGGMSAVYAARHLRLDRRVAVKVLSPELRHHPEAVERFAREARICASLGSPHIAMVFDFNRMPDGVPYMVIELLHGEDLAQRLALDGALPPGTLVDLLGQACDGLCAAHAEGIVHRDIKPSNLFLCDSEEPRPLLKLLDFGISKIKGQLASLTGTQQILGTPGYMSPEMVSGRGKEVDARADLFSLGAVAYEALSGRAPFSGDTIPATLFRIAYEEPVPLAELRPELPAALCALVAELLQKDPAQRPASARDVKARLAGLVDGALPPTRLAAATTPGRAAAPEAPRRTRRRGLMLALGAGGALLATLAVGWRLGWHHRPPPAQAPAGSPGELSAPRLKPATSRPIVTGRTPAWSPTSTGPQGARREPSTSMAARPDAGQTAGHRPPRRSPPRPRVDNDPLL